MHLVWAKESGLGTTRYRNESNRTTHNRIGIYIWLSAMELLARTWDYTHTHTLEKPEKGWFRGGNYSVPNYRAPRACRADRHKINTRVCVCVYMYV